MAKQFTDSKLPIQRDIVNAHCEWAGLAKEYRYVLYRGFGSTKPILAVIGLNPSIADEQYDDRTVRKCIYFARRDGYGKLAMLNAFAYRATSPEYLKICDNPVGIDNDAWILTVCSVSEKVIVAWGKHGKLFDRDIHLLKILGGIDLYCFGKNKDDTPKHPLYLPNNVKIEMFREKEYDREGCRYG